MGRQHPQAQVRTRVSENWVSTNAELGTEATDEGP